MKQLAHLWYACRVDVREREVASGRASTEMRWNAVESEGGGGRGREGMRREEEGNEAEREYRHLRVTPGLKHRQPPEFVPGTERISAFKGPGGR